MQINLTPKTVVTVAAGWSASWTVGAYIGSHVPAPKLHHKVMVVATGIVAGSVVNRYAQVAAARMYDDVANTINKNKQDPFYSTRR